MNVSKHGAARIVRATKREEKRILGGGVPPRPRPGAAPSGGFWAQITSSTTATTQGTGPRSTYPGDAYAGRYSFQSIYYKPDGTAVLDPSGVFGDRTQADGYALELNGITTVPQGSLVFIRSVATDPATSHYYFLFQYDLCLMARTKVITSYPGVAAVMYGMETQLLSGNPSEGAAASITTAGDTFFALNMGTAVPPQGTSVVCSRVWTTRGAGPTDTGSPPQSYWAFRYDG